MVCAQPRPDLDEATPTRRRPVSLNPVPRSTLDRGLRRRRCAVVSHDAPWDRPLLEKLLWDIAVKPWACSIADVPWDEYGVDSCRLLDIAEHHGLFFRDDRAGDDCSALTAVLATRTQRPHPAFRDLPESVGREGMQIDAIAVSYALQEISKRRRHLWVQKADGSPAAWRNEVAPGDLKSELAWLDRNVCCGGDTCASSEPGLRSRAIARPEA